MQTFTLNKKDLLAISRFAPTKDIRHYLNCVMLEINKTDCRLVATDGRA